MTLGTSEHEQWRSCRYAARTQPTGQGDDDCGSQRRCSQLTERRNVGDAEHAMRKPDAGQSGAERGDRTGQSAEKRELTEHGLRELAPVRAERAQQCSLEAAFVGA